MATNKDSFIARQIVQISTILNNYAREQSNSSSNDLPNGIKQMIINYYFFWIVCNAAYKFILNRDSEGRYKLHAAINFILKQIQLRFDPEHYDSDEKAHVKFMEATYIEYKSYKLNLEQMTDIAIDFIHLAYVHKFVSAVDIGEYLCHRRTFVDESKPVSDIHYTATFLISYLTKRGLAEYTKSTLGANDDKNLLKTFKYFVNECEFKVPAEARLIERFLEGFAAFYSKMHYGEDGGMWNDTYAIFIAINALLMFNTSHSNPRIKEGDKIKMSVFKGMVQGIKVNGKSNEFFADKMIQMALDIKQSPIHYTRFT